MAVVSLNKSSNVRAIIQMTLRNKGADDETSQHAADEICATLERDGLMADVGRKDVNAILDRIELEIPRYIGGFNAR